MTPNSPPAALDGPAAAWALAAAREAVVRCARRLDGPSGDELPRPPAGPLHLPQGSFVTLRCGESLRGCIGRIVDRRPLWEGILGHARAAAAHDPRFDPVIPDELVHLTLEISALSPPRSIPHWREFEVGLHGVVLELDAARAVFLPEVAVEHAWDRPTTLSWLARKAGLPREAWRDPRARFAIFTSSRCGGPVIAGASEQRPPGRAEGRQGRPDPQQPL